MPENHIYHVTESVSDAERNAVIRTVMMMAPPFSIGNCKVCNVDIRMLSMDMEYQRNPRQKSKKLREEFDMNEVDPIVLSYRDGMLFVIDGGHRIDAALYNGINILPAKIHENMTQADEAKKFAQQKKNVVNVSPYDQFRANIIYGEETDTAIKSVCDKYGMTVTCAPKGKIRPMTAITACRDVMHDPDYDGETILDWAFGIMEKVNWLDDRNAVACKVIKAFQDAYREAQRANALDDYTGRIIEVLSHINVNQFTSFANIRFPQFEKRTTANVAMSAIARGDITFDDIKAIANN